MAFALAPLEQLLRPSCDDELAQRVGVARRTVIRWRNAGLSARVADRAACAVDLHPVVVWGDAWLQAPR